MSPCRRETLIREEEYVFMLDVSTQARLGYPNLLIMFAGGVLFVIGRGIDRS